MIQWLQKVWHAITTNEPPPVIKPTWDELLAILLARGKTISADLSLAGIRFKKNIQSKLGNVEQLGTLMSEQLAALERRDFVDLKTRAVIRQKEASLVLLDDFLLTDERHYVKGIQLDVMLDATIEQIKRIIELRESNFDAKIVINQYFDILLDEYWALFVNTTSR